MFQNKSVILYLFVAITMLLILEAQRFFTPFTFLDNNIIQNSISILVFIGIMFMFGWLYIEENLFFEMVYEGIRFATIAWIFFGILGIIYVVFIGVVSSSNGGVTVEAFVPFIASFFIYFIMGCVLASLVKYVVKTHFD